MRFLALATLIVAACGIDTSSLSKADLAMRDAPIVPKECMNGFTDGAETDLDCGGPTCSPCDTGKACKKGRDCLSTFCTNSVCDAPSCMDGVKNGSESDKDCGGSCAGCAVGKLCNNGFDCQSMTCTNGTCAASPCTNGKQDGAETDVDCGGGTCDGCEDGKMCQLGSDCKGMTCTNNVCKGAGNCMDGMKNGSETDVDCGGGSCRVCADGLKCLADRDCAGGHCTNQVCQGSTYLPVGVVTNVPVANLTGWSPCYADTYASKGTLLTQVMNACNKAKLFFGCRFAGQPTLLVGAWIERSKVSLLPQIAGAAGSKTSWMFAQRVNGDGCWAFVPDGDTLPGGACNLDSGGATHLSWSIYDAQLAAGYRCGLDRNIASNAYERLIYHAD